VYERNDEPAKSVKAFINAVKLCEKYGIRTRLSWHYLNVGNAYLGLNDVKNSERYFQKSITNPDDSSKVTRAHAFGNLGYILLNKKEYEKAHELFDRAETLYRENSADSHSNFATIDL